MRSAITSIAAASRAGHTPSSTLPWMLRPPLPITMSLRVKPTTT